MSDATYIDTTQDGYELGDLLRALINRWIVVCAIIVFGVLSTVYAVSNKTPLYSSQALVILSQSRTALEQERAPLQNNAQINALVSSELRYLTSDNFLLSLLRSQDLAQSPEFGGPRLDYVSPADNEAVPPNQIEGDLLPALRSRMMVSREGASYVVSITFLAEDPQKAAELANAAAARFAQSALDRGARTARALALKVAAELPRRLLDVQKAEAVLDEVMIAEIEAQTDNLASQTLTTLKALAERQASLDSTVASLVNRDKLSENPFASLGSIEARQAEIYAQKRRLWQDYAVERSSDPTFLITDSRAAEAFQSVDLARGVYGRLLTRLNDLELEASLYVPTARVLAPALVPFKPSHPKKTMSVALSVILSTAFAVAAALFLEFFSGKIVKPNHLPTVIPNENRFFFSTPAKKLERGLFSKTGRQEQHLVLERDRLFAALNSIPVDPNMINGRIINLVSAGHTPNFRSIAAALGDAYQFHDQEVALLDLRPKRKFGLGTFAFWRRGQAPKIVNDQEPLTGMDRYRIQVSAERRRLGDDQKFALVERLSQRYDTVLVIPPFRSAHSENTVFATVADANVIVSQFRVTKISVLNEITAWIGSANPKSRLYSVAVGKV